MRPSSTLDKETGEVYPDIFSTNYSSFTFTSSPKKRRVDQRYIEKPYLITYDEYGSFWGDDIILDINLIPHYTYLNIKLPLYIPSSADLNSFIKNQSNLVKSKNKV
jgi:hypothetical protein